MSTDPTEQTALFRYRVIAEAANPRLSAAERGQLVRELAARTHELPDGSRDAFSRATLDHWIRAYRDGGLIRHIQLRSLDLTVHDAELVPDKKQLRFRVAHSEAHINQIEEQPKQRVHEIEEHRRSTSYRSGDPTPSSLPADE